MFKTYETEDQAAARVDTLRKTIGCWPAMFRVRYYYRGRHRIGWRLTFDPDIAAGERVR